MKCIPQFAARLEIVNRALLQKLLEEVHSGRLLRKAPLRNIPFQKKRASAQSLWAMKLNGQRCRVVGLDSNTAESPKEAQYWEPENGEKQLLAPSAPINPAIS
jgi:hypothetical protein